MFRLDSAKPQNANGDTILHEQQPHWRDRTVSEV